MIEPIGLETLSVDTGTGKAGWRAVSHLFRRRFRGTMLEIHLAGNRVIRATDRHPMLSSRTTDSRSERPATWTPETASPSSTGWPARRE